MYIYIYIYVPVIRNGNEAGRRTGNDDDRHEMREFGFFFLISIFVFSLSCLFDSDIGLWVDGLLSSFSLKLTRQLCSVWLCISSFLILWRRKKMKNTNEGERERKREREREREEFENPVLLHLHLLQSPHLPSMLKKHFILRNQFTFTFMFLYLKPLLKT